jgi:hypothetical protein
MVDIYKIASLDVNGMSAVGMKILGGLLHKQKIDIPVLQDVTHTEFDIIGVTWCTQM